MFWVSDVVKMDRMFRRGIKDIGERFKSVRSKDIGERFKSVRSSSQSNAQIVFFSKNDDNPHCFVLDGSRDRCECDVTIELK